MDLVSEAGNSFSFHRTFWRQALQLAKAYGWTPAGTLSVDYQWPEQQEDTTELSDVEPTILAIGPERGSYWFNEGWLVEAQDAAALAGAIERALLDITDEVPGGAPPWGVDPAGPPLEFWAGAGKDWLREFIAFARQGGFFIW